MEVIETNGAMKLGIGLNSYIEMFVEVLKRDVSVTDAPRRTSFVQ